MSDTMEDLQAQLRIAWGVVTRVGSELRTVNDVVIPAWQATAKKLRMWLLGMNIVEAGLCAELATLREQLADAKRVIDAGRVWDESVEQGFASEMRPDIAHALFLRALRDYDAKHGK